MRNILFEASPINRATGLPVTVRMAGAQAANKDNILDGYAWQPCITEWPKRTINFMDGEGFYMPVEISHGSISFLIHSDFGNTAWPSYEWNGALCRIWIGNNEGDAFASYTQIFEGYAGPLSDRDHQSVSVSLLGRESILEKNLLTASYQGTGNAEGPASLLGTLKPWCSGPAQNVDPILINASLQIYQVHGYGAINAVSAVYENALSLGAATGADQATYAALAALTLAEGQWARCTALGLFRLGAEPSGKVTADVQGAKDGATYVDDFGEVATHLLKQSGLSTSYINTASFAAWDTGDKWSLYRTDQITVGDAVRKCLFDAGGYLIPGSTGVFYVGNYWTMDSVSISSNLTEDRSTTPSIGSIRQLATSAPIWKVRHGGNPCWSTHSPNEISPAIAELQDDVDAANAAALAAQADADLAQADATVALARLASIAADNVLDRVDKVWVVEEFARFTGEKAGLNSTATGLGITTENTTYNTAYSTLSSYLSGLSPAYTNTTADTTIVRATWDANWTALTAARNALRNKVALEAAKRANWPDISGTGKPADNATANVTLATLNTGLTLVGNKATLTAHTGEWTTGFYSNECFTGTAFVSGRIIITASGSPHSAMIALDSTQRNAAAFKRSADYSWIRTATGGCNPWVAGSQGPAFTGATDSTLFTITYDGTRVNWWMDGVLKYTMPTTPSQKLYAAGAWYGYPAMVGTSIDVSGFGPYADTLWANIGGANKAADNATANNILVGHGAGSITIEGSSVRFNSTTGGNWNNGFYTRDAYPGTCYVQSRIVNAGYNRTFGLTADWTVNVSGNYQTSIQYGWQRGSADSQDIIINGTNITSIAGTATDAKLYAVYYDGVNIRWFIDGVEVYTVAASAANLTYRGRGLFWYTTNSAGGGEMFKDFTAGYGTDNAWATIGGANRPSDNATNDLSLIEGGTAGKIVITGNKIVQTATTGSWATWAYSNRSFIGTAYTSFRTTGGTNTPIVGLATPANKNVSGFASVSYGILLSGTNVYCVESGAVITLSTTATATDVLTCAYDGANVRYFKNDTVLRTVAATAGVTFHPKAMFDSGTTTIYDLSFGAFTDNAWSTISGTGKPADNATVGAAWGTNLTGRPTEVTDGRIATALDSSGRLQSRLIDGAILGTSGSETVTNVIGRTSKLTTGGKLSDYTAHFAAGIVGFRNTNNIALTSDDFSSAARISIPSHVRKVPISSGAQSITYNSGSITGLSYSTQYWIYTDDANLAGGAVTYVANADPDSVIGTGRVWVGYITTPAPGGSSSGGGGGYNGGGPPYSNPIP